MSAAGGTVSGDAISVDLIQFVCCPLPLLAHPFLYRAV